MSKPNEDASLLSKQSMGGINGGKGFKAQEAYICIKIPGWFADPSFSRILNEGSGDIDIRFERDGQVERHYYQVKDHLVDKSEFRAVLEQFKQKHEADAEFNRFILVSGGLHPSIKSFQVALERVRRAADMHAGTATGQASEEALQQHLADLDLPVDAAWALAHLEVEDSEHIRTWPNSTESLRDEFVGKTWKVYTKAQRPGLSRAFDALHTFISGAMGQTLSREELEAVLHQAIAENNLEIQNDGLSLFLDVWGDQDAKARAGHDAILNWRNHFDRETRRVPSTFTWTKELLPELNEIQQRFRDAGTNRHVHIRGNAPLSVGLAVGAAFAAVKGYRLSIDQHSDVWHSDESPSAVRVDSPNGIEILDHSSETLCVEISGVRGVRRKVKEFEEATQTRFSARLQLQVDPELSRWTAADAVAIARALRRHIINAHDQHGFKEIHLFFALPLGAAILLGHSLNSVGIVQTYEEQIVGGYAPSCRLDLH